MTDPLDFDLDVDFDDPYFCWSCMGVCIDACMENADHRLLKEARSG